MRKFTPVFHHRIASVSPSTVILKYQPLSFSPSGNLARALSVVCSMFIRSWRNALENKPPTAARSSARGKLGHHSKNREKLREQMNIWVNTFDRRGKGEKGEEEEEGFGEAPVRGRGSSYTKGALFRMLVLSALRVKNCSIKLGWRGGRGFLLAAEWGNPIYSAVDKPCMVRSGSCACCCWFMEGHSVGFGMGLVGDFFEVQKICPRVLAD